MTRNEGSIDRIVRVAIGVIALVIAFTGVVGSGPAWGIGIVGAVLFVTGAVGFCPAYALFGLRTCPAPRSKA